MYVDVMCIWKQKRISHTLSAFSLCHHIQLRAQPPTYTHINIHIPIHTHKFKYSEVLGKAFNQQYVSIHLLTSPFLQIYILVIETRTKFTPLAPPSKTIQKLGSLVMYIRRLGIYEKELLILYGFQPHLPTFYPFEHYPHFV